MENKKNIPVWIWIILGILVTLVVVLFFSLGYWVNNSVSLEDYTMLVNEYGDSVKDYADLGQDYLNLLGCYQKGLPRCDFLIQKYGNSSVFTQGRF